jgi:hypothetical protein
MGNAMIQRVWDQVRALPPEDQRALRDMLENLTAAPTTQAGESGKQEELTHRLVSAGVIARALKPIPDPGALRNRTLAETSGKPVSETVVEERR